MTSKTNNLIPTLLRRSCLFLLLFICMGTLAYGASEHYLKVGLSYNYNEYTTVKISCSSGLSIGEINANGWNVTSSFLEIKTVTVLVSNGIVQVKKEDGTVLVESLSTNQGVFPIEKGEVIYANSDGYRGGYCFFPVDQNRMNLINYVELEDYVRGVVHSEIGQRSPLETLKAQAVCARSYAISNMGKHKAAGYDVCAATDCQVYKGYKNEYPSTNQACTETQGQVIKYKGKTVSAYYSKNDGGHTDNVEDIWGTKVGYLRGVRDEFSPLFKWEKTYTFQELAELLNKAGHSVGNISSVTITQRNSSGTASKLAIWDERKQTIVPVNSSKIIPGLTIIPGLKNIPGLRNILGMNTIKSGMFSFSPIGPKDLEDALENSTSVIKNFGTVTVINLNQQRTYSKTLQIIGRDLLIRDAEAGTLAISNGKLTVLPKEQTDTPSETFTPIINLGTESQLSSPITFYGLGWGHGLGMAQDSIIAMGKLGYDYKYMLNYFFTDIKIEAWNN